MTRFPMRRRSHRVLRFSIGVLILLCVLFWTPVSFPKHIRQLSFGAPNDSSSEVTAVRSKTTIIPQPEPSQNVATQQQEPSQPERRIVFVHVGKAAGTTIERSLRAGCGIKRNHNGRKGKCLQQFDAVNETALSKKVDEIVHMVEVTWTDFTNYTSYLFNLRHPLDRTKSAYLFDHPLMARVKRRGKSLEQRAAFYDDCFPTFDDFTNTVLSALDPNHDAKNTSSSSSCTLLAFQALRGQPHRSFMLYENYQFYAKHTMINKKGEQQSDKEILVLRSEELWQDMTQLDVVLGGTGEFDHAGEVSNKIPDNVTQQQRSIALSSDDWRHTFCCVLWREMDVYQDILLRAVNLDATQKQHSLQHLYSECGREVPSIKVKNNAPAMTSRSASAIPAQDGEAERSLANEVPSWEDWHKESCPRVKIQVERKIKQSRKARRQHRKRRNAE